MAHAVSLKTMPHRPEPDEPIPRSAKVTYVVIMAALLAVAVAFFAVWAILNSVDNRQIPVQQNNNSANPGGTEDTGAPTQDSESPTDRVNPAPSGSGGNTLLNPEEI